MRRIPLTVSLWLLAVLACGIFTHPYCMVIHRDWSRDGQYFFIFPTSMGIGFIVALLPVILAWKPLLARPSIVTVASAYLIFLVILTSAVQLGIGGSWSGIRYWISNVARNLTFASAFLIMSFRAGGHFPTPEAASSVLSVLPLIGMIIFVRSCRNGSA